MGVAALAATLAISAYTTNRHVRRKLKLSAFLFAGYVLVHAVVALAPGLAAGLQFESFERLAFAAALINLFVIALVNPLRADRIPDGFPAILQDAIVIAILVLVSTFFFQDQLITTSAVGAVVVGFALQDTLGNAFAGLAIQSEKPFRVGHWIRVGDFEGRVAEVTWRATKLRTKTGNFVIVRNNIIANPSPWRPRAWSSTSARVTSARPRTSRPRSARRWRRCRACSKRLLPTRSCTPSMIRQ